MFAANRPCVLSSPEPFKALAKSPFTFIIWNLYVTDKLVPLTQEALNNHYIKEIIAILPEEEDFKKLNADIGDIPVTVLAYHHNHTPVLPKEQYDSIAKKIDTIARLPPHTNRGILVFCNNGYQRSLPFLVYYMTKYHSEEFPTIDKAVGFLLSTLRSANTFEEKIEILKRINELFYSE